MMVAELCDIVLILAKSQLFMLIIMGRKFTGSWHRIAFIFYSCTGRIIIHIQDIR